MGIKHIIILASAAVVSFTGAFAAAWLTRPAAAGAIEPNNASTAVAIQQAGFEQSKEKSRQRALAEEQLRALIRQLQDKIQQYQQKLQALEADKQRAEMAAKQLHDQIKRLEDLRVEVAAAVATLKAEKDELARTRIRIEQAEQANLRLLANTYDKMDPDSAAKLLVNMCKAKTQLPRDMTTNIEDAVKLLFYMNEKRRAAVLGSMMQVDPDVTAFLALRIKQIVEG